MKSMETISAKHNQHVAVLKSHVYQKDVKVEIELIGKVKDL